MKNLLSSAAIGLLCLPVWADDKLEEVVVSASRTQTDMRSVAVSVTVVDRQMIERSGLVEVAELLRTQVGVAASNSGGPGKDSAVRIRGEDSFRTLFVLDGVELTDPTGTQMSTRVEYLSLGQELERIEILRGPQGFQYGADAGGVVNMLSREAQRSEGALRLEKGKYDSDFYQAYIAGKAAGVNGFAAASHWASEGFNARQDDESLEADGYRNTTVHGKLSAQINPAWSLSGVLRAVDSRVQYDTCFRTDFSATNDCISDTAQHAARLAAAYAPNPDHQHSFAISRSDIEVERFADGQFSSGAEGDIEKAEYLGNLKLNESWHLGVGADTKTESMQSSQRSQSGIFSELRYQYRRELYLGGGLRLDEHDVFGQHLSSRLSAAYIHALQAGAYLKYRAAWGTGFRAPSLFEADYNASSGVELAALHEESTTGGEVAVELHSGNGGEATIVYFEQAITDAIEYDLIEFIYVQGDGVSHSKGLELSTVYPIGERFEVLANYTYNDTLTAQDTVRARRPRHLFNAALSARLLDEKLLLFMSLRRSVDAQAIDSTNLPNYSVIDANAQYRASKHIEFHLRCRNLADENYVEVLGYNTAARNCAVGLQANF